MKDYENKIKRFCDVAASAAGLAVAALPLTGIFCAMALANKSSPFFAQTRVGKDGKLFRIYKIKTLRDAFNAAGQPLPDHERATTLGTFLRKTRIDELPQFVNILKGEMSLVGPRPLQPEHKIAHDPLRQSVRPGLLGASQIYLARGQASSLKLAMDLDYIRNQA